MVINPSSSGSGGGSVELVTGQVLHSSSMGGSATIYYVNPDMTVADISSIDNDGESFEVVKGTILSVVFSIRGFMNISGGLSIITGVSGMEALTCYEVTADFTIEYAA